jgi:putative tryptophan/tyrosine transport system substrate-binding protein
VNAIIVRWNAAATPQGYARQLEGLRAGLQDHGYIEGQNVAVEFRWAEGRYDRLSALARELVQQKVDVLVTHGTPGTNALRNATSTIPIVMAVSGDAHLTGLVQSLARPGGNVTGLTYFASDHASKRLELIREIIPSLSRVAFLTNPANPLMKIEWDAVGAAAKSLQIEVEAFEVRVPGDFDGAVSAMVERGYTALVTGQDGMLIGNVSGIASSALKKRVAACGEAPLANAGGLLGYSANHREMFRRAAYYVDRLLKGTKPAELPVERPTSFDLALNLKTAQALGLPIPPTLFARADEVIE